MKVSTGSNNNSNGGITFFGLLAIAFIVMKLAGLIHWSWVWVLAPLWMPSAAAVIIALVIVLIGKL